MSRLLLCMLMAMAMAGGATAQTLQDPTLPPPESRQLAPGVTDVATASSGPQLQSVLIGSRGREVAVIDGQTVRKGEKFNGAVLVKVGKNEVVLQNGRHQQILKLFPDAAADGKKSAPQR